MSFGRTVVAIATVVGSVATVSTVPEVRRFFNLDSPQWTRRADQTPSLSTARPWRNTQRRPDRARAAVGERDGHSADPMHGSVLLGRPADRNLRDTLHLQGRRLAPNPAEGVTTSLTRSTEFRDTIRLE